MSGTNRVAEVAALYGDPARLSMLYALKDDSKVGAGDLARVAGVSPSTASEHLSKMSVAGLVRVEKEGRARVYRIADAKVAEALEGLEALAVSINGAGDPISPRDRADVHCRACLDHLSGRFGSRLLRALIEMGAIAHAADGLEVTEEGEAWFPAFGIDLDTLRRGPRRFAGFCWDWFDGSPHLGGALGGALTARLVARGWLRYETPGRRVRITPTGAGGFRSEFGIDIRDPGAG